MAHQTRISKHTAKCVGRNLVLEQLKTSLPVLCIYSVTVDVAHVLKKLQHFWYNPSEWGGSGGERARPRILPVAEEPRQTRARARVVVEAGPGMACPGVTSAQGARQAAVEEGVGRLRETRARWCVADTCPQHRLHGVRGLFASYLRIPFSIFILLLSEQKIHTFI